MSDNPFVGSWTYRSFLNDTDVNKSFNDLEFGRGTIVIEEGPTQALKGTIGGPGWSLALKGARAYGELPATCIKYVRRIEELVGCPVALLSTSPQREDTILMTDPFRD